MIENSNINTKNTDRKKREFQWKEGVSFSLNKEQKSHNTFIMKIYYNEKDAGYAELEYNPDVNSFELAVMQINTGYTDKQLSSNLIECVNSFLDSKEMRGYLYNVIDFKNPEDKANFAKSGVYERHGWRWIDKDTGKMERLASKN